MPCSYRLIHIQQYMLKNAKNYAYGYNKWFSLERARENEDTSIGYLNCASIHTLSLNVRKYCVFLK